VNFAVPRHFSKTANSVTIRNFSPYPGAIEHLFDERPFDAVRQNENHSQFQVFPKWGKVCEIYFQIPS